MAKTAHLLVLIAASLQISSAFLAIPVSYKRQACPERREVALKPLSRGLYIASAPQHCICATANSGDEVNDVKTEALMDVMSDELDDQNDNEGEVESESQGSSFRKRRAEKKRKASSERQVGERKKSWYERGAERERNHHAGHISRGVPHAALLPLHGRASFSVFDDTLLVDRCLESCV